MSVAGSLGHNRQKNKQTAKKHSFSCPIERSEIGLNTIARVDDMSVAGRDRKLID